MVRCVLWHGGESDLVVDDQVDGAAGAVSAEAERSAGSRRRRPGPRRRRRRARGSAARSAADRLASCLARTMPSKTAVDGFEVRRVGGEVDGELLAAVIRRRSPGCRGGTSHRPSRSCCPRRAALELAEHLAIGLACDVREHVEAPAVGHADRGAAKASLGRALEDLVQDRDEPTRHPRG